MTIAKRCERQRQPRERRNGSQHLKQRIERAHRPHAVADEHADRNADDRRERVAERDALEAREQMPEQSLVDAAVVVERIDDQFPGVAHHRRRRWQARARRGSRELPDAEQHRECDERRNDDLRSLDESRARSCCPATRRARVVGRHRALKRSGSRSLRSDSAVTVAHCCSFDLLECGAGSSSAAPHCCTVHTRLIARLAR